MRGSMFVAPTVAVVLLAGCTAQEPNPEQTHTDALARTASPGAETACGIDVRAIELMTGLVVTRTTEELVITDGQGTGVCHGYSDDETAVWVTLDGLSSTEAVNVRLRMTGEKMNPPDAVFDPAEADGGMWGSRVIGAGSAVFWGPTMVRVSVDSWAPGRNMPADLLAATYQVADSYGLERPSPS